MRLTEAHISNYRSIGDVHVPLDGLTVLTDPHPRLVEDVLIATQWMLQGGLTPQRLDLAATTCCDDIPEGSVTVALDHRATTGSRDEKLALGLLEEHISDWLGHAAVEFAGMFRHEELLEIFVKGFVRGSINGDLEDRESLAEAIISAPTLVRGYCETSLQIRLSDLDSSQAAAATRLACWPGGDDLIDIARELCAETSSAVITLETGFGFEDTLCEVVDLSVPVADLAEFLRAAITDTAEMIGCTSSAEGVLRLFRHTLNGQGSWLGVILPDGDHKTRCDPHPESPPVDAPVAIRPRILEAATLLARHATRLAPSFIRDFGSIEIVVDSPMYWAAHPDRLHVEFHGNDGTRQSFKDLDTGLARWIEIALRLAVADLASLESAPDAAENDLLDSMDAAATDLPLVVDEINLCPLFAPPGDRYVIVEEPERHLPAPAVASVGAWLEALGRVHLGVLVTTWSDAIADLDANVPQLSIPASV